MYWYCVRLTPAAEGQILAGLEVDVDVLDLRQLGPHALDELSAETPRWPRGFSCTNMRAGCSEGRSAPVPAKADDALRPPDPAQDAGHFALPLDHRGEGNVLAALDRDEDEAGVLLRKQALGDDDVEPAGQAGQGDRSPPG